MKNIIRAIALLFAFSLPNSASAASSTLSEAFGFSLFKRDVKKSKKVRVKKRRKVRSKKYSKRKKAKRTTRSKSKRRKSATRASRKAKARRIARKKKRARKAKARRIAASKRRELYSRKAVFYASRERRGTIIIDTRSRHLYYIEGPGRATRYGVAVGKRGFSWSGTSRIRRKVTWPTWTPPKEMIERSPKLAKWKNGQPGGPSNPLGAAALYLYKGKVDTLYRIHGTNNPGSIGRAASSGCIRMRNKDIQHLYAKVGNGTKVIVR